MRQKFTLAAVLVFFTLCSFGQKKEIMRNNFLRTNVKTHSDRHFPYGSNQVKPGDRQNDFLTAKTKTRKPSDLKSALAFKQRLDSIVEFTDANIPDYKVDFTYDSKGNNTQYISYEWDINTNIWDAFWKTAYTYDANGNITQEIDYYWDSNSNSYLASGKSDYTYDAGGNNTQYIGYKWNNNAWVANWKNDYTYDAKGNMTQQIQYNWSATTSSLVANSKYNYTYDASGNMAQELYYYWDDNLNIWNTAPSRKTDYTYDSQGNNTQELLSYWDSNTSTWGSDYKYQYTYDASGHMTQERSYNWDSNTNVWVSTTQKSGGDFTYDANGNETSDIYYDFDQITSQLIATDKYEFTYNLSYNFSDLIFPPEFIDSEGMVMNMPLEGLYYSWDKTSNSWVMDFTDVYYYSNISITAVPKTVASGIDIYPNPVADYIKVSGITGVSTFNLYNLQGKLILSKTLTGDEPVKVSGLSKGAYFYNLTVDQKKQAGKIIKK